MGNQDKYEAYCRRALDACKHIYIKHDWDIYSLDFMRDMLDQLDPIIEEGETLLNANLFEGNTEKFWRTETFVLALRGFRTELVYQLAESN